VSILQAYDGEPYDLLVALHARRSHSSIVSFRRHNPEVPVIVALTGPDLYRDIRTNHLARKSLEIATRIVVLQPKAIDELRPSLQDKTRVIYQSVEGVRKPAAQTKARKQGRRERFGGNFDVCVVGHLRAVKDPFRAAMAARLLPPSSRIRVLQVGGALTEAMAARARKEMRVNQRYEWLGEQPRSRVRRILARSRLCVLSSRMEGGANVLSEAIVAFVPILASRIDGNIGILGADYPGYFAVGDTKQLAQLLRRAETCSEFLVELEARVNNLAPLFSPLREEQAWADLICELSG
jgi:putative glycosyltransferase (TIGR04348 family)